MEKAKIKELLVGHKQRFFLKTGLIERDIQEEINRFIPQREIVLITGVRRSGKSSLMRLICDDIVASMSVPLSNILYLNFDDERFVDFKVDDFELLYESFLELESPNGRKYLFFDEIQNIKGWERWLNRLYEFEDVKIFVSGSNASMLGSEISTVLTGRNRQVVNWPFSFREFLRLRKYNFEKNDIYLREKRVEIKKMLREYFELGGFPEVLKNNDPTLLEQYYRDILYRDIIARYSIKHIKEIKELSLFLASNIGTIHSYRSMQSAIGAKSITTIKNYLELLAEVFLFRYTDIFDYSVKRQIYNPSKVYCVDAALSSSIGFTFSQNKGHIYENIVYIELLRRKSDIYYWKSKKGKEVDFIIKRGLKATEAIQVCFSLDDEKTRQREFQALVEAKNDIGIESLTVITDDEDGNINIDGADIKITPLWKWLIKQPLAGEA